MSGKYALGHSPNELRRLATQARLINPITSQFFHEAGLATGMRVLDIGSGAGDVAMLVARIIGKDGEVVGTDKSETAIAVARSRVKESGIRNVSFIEGDPADMKFEQPFDAVVGRYILQFLPDPASSLAKISRHLRPEGILVFHELDWDGARSSPPVPSYDLCCKWCAETIGRLGAETRMGVKLHSIFSAAGLNAPAMRLESVIGAGAECADVLHLVIDLVETLISDIERLGVATSGEIGLENLFERVFEEVIAKRGTVIGRSEIGAWTRR